MTGHRHQKSLSPTLGLAGYVRPEGRFTDNCLGIFPPPPPPSQLSHTNCHHQDITTRYPGWPVAITRDNYSQMEGFL